MKKTFFSMPNALLLHALTTFLIGIGCTYPLSLSLGLTAPLSLSVGCCALVTLAFALLSCLPRLRALAYPLLLAVLCVFVFSLRGQMNAISAALTLLLNGHALALAAYSRALVVLFSLVFTGVGAALSRSEQAFFPLALLVIVLLFIVSFLGIEVGAFSLLPLVLALILSGRAPGVSAKRLIPMAAAALGIVALMMPMATQTVPELNDFARRMRQKIDDYLFFTEPRTTFSLSTTGYQPLGVSQLGGPANPEEAPVMQVRTSGRTLLRGAIKNEYDGSAWTDSTSGRRYLLVNPRFILLRRNLFDLDRPEKALRSQLPQSELITVLMRSDSVSTLYLTQRFSALSGEGIVPYFSPASEVFGTRSLTLGDSYTFSGTRMSYDTQGVRDVVLAASQAPDQLLEGIRETYLSVPSGVEPDVYALVTRITQDAQNDFDRAAALCAYLRSAYSYTLDQNIPPTDRDFVSWFLLTERQGYCTSFASAMAVMARIAGLPSRYIEGYAAVPDSDGTARVTQRNAHAWTEIYFSGFGWLSFDATPGYGTENTSDDGNLPDNPPAASPSPSPTPTPDAPPSPSPSPQITPTPSPENQPDATPTPSPTPEPTPSPDDPDAVPTPTPSPTPPPDDSEKNPPPGWLWLLLILLILAAAVAARLYFCAPARVAGRQSSPNDALFVWYRAIEEVLLCMGIAAMPGEAPATFLLRAQTQLGEAVKLTTLGKALCVAQYSAHTLKRTQPERAEKTYSDLLALMKPMQKLRLYVRRLLPKRGIH